MRLFLQDGPARLQILSREHLREFHDITAAREFLRPFLQRPGNAAAVRRALDDAGHANLSSSDAELLERLAQQIVTQRLAITSCADSYLAATHGTFTEAAASGATAAAAPPADAPTPLDDEQAATAARADAPGPEEQHWIEIELLDDDGKPVPHARYSIDLPDGSMRTGTTDASGRAREDDIDPGTARVSFPEYDQDSYDESGGGS
jgi:hypothetical protein